MGDYAGGVVGSLQKRRDVLNEVMNWAEEGTAKGPQAVAEVQAKQAAQKKKDSAAKPRWYLFGLDK